VIVYQFVGHSKRLSFASVEPSVAAASVFPTDRLVPLITTISNFPSGVFIVSIYRDSCTQGGIDKTGKGCGSSGAGVVVEGGLRD
jgi:hypothetical protein